jgi:hypothetical protein
MFSDGLFGTQFCGGSSPTAPAPSHENQTKTPVMKSLLTRRVLFALSLAVALTACDKTEPGIDPNENDYQGSPTEVGQPIGEPVSKTIGPAGGELTSADGSVTVKFPAGAVVSETTILLQQVTQTAPVQTESPSVALLPADLSLKKPVEISYSKARPGQRTTDEAAGQTGGWIARQRGDNAWEVNPGSITETNNEVTVKVARMGYYTHFYPYIIETKNMSSWGMLVPNEPVQLLVRRNFVSSAGSNGAVILRPLSQTPAHELAIQSDQITQVLVNGHKDGTVGEGLLSINYNAATGYNLLYTAPQRTPVKAPVTITAHFKTAESGARTASTRLSVGNDCEYTFNGVTVRDATAMGSVANGGLSVSLQGEGGGYHVAFQLSGAGTGTYPFKFLENTVTAGNLDMFGQIYYQSKTKPGGDMEDNPGTVTITGYEPVKGFPNRHFVRGKIQGKLSRPYDCGNGTCWEDQSIQAEFAFVF